MGLRVGVEGETEDSFINRERKGGIGEGEGGRRKASDRKRKLRTR